MKKIQCALASAVVAGAIFSSSISFADAASYGPVLTQLTKDFPFTDVPVDRKEPVQYLYSHKFINGVSTDKFGWDRPIKRVDAALIIAYAIGFEKDPTPTLEEKTFKFKDVPVRAYEAIFWLQDRGIINGKTATLFGSNDTITRGEMAIIASRAYDNFLEAPGKANHSFTDATGRYVTAINRLQASNITQGKSVTQFGTYDKMTRGDLALMLYKLDHRRAVYSDGDLPPSNTLPSIKSGVMFKTEKENYNLSTETEVLFTVTNLGDFKYDVDNDYILEKKQDDEWVAVEYNYLPTPAMMNELVPGGNVLRTDIDFDLFKKPPTAGEYRLVQHFSLTNAPNNGFTLAAYFTIIE
ncbi:S-layer homology domain-containing protein [Domibacillus aminovorans]|uniref:SLH domain-containing protein n=1 Tax=Domibacillus aminovorans TaxID=29332 RepID=A0A177L5W1_9BACI|nr:S-layer homology domain-containing protein [Domibacillus aminovorans]OAH60141.1 hypothetical protein AWH49_17965 [Domibacillus aminovorans]